MTNILPPRVITSWLGRLGPGLLFAATAVGVSHLVQSTRAGAEFGLTLLVLILVACAVKYPAFRFGAEYAALTGRTVLSGYERQGRWLLALILLATVIEGVGVVPAVTLVTVGLGMNLLGAQVDPIIATVAMVFAASIVLLVGRYRVLENITRVFVALFAIMTVLATLAAIAGINPGQPLAAPFELKESNLFFSVSVAGWMPIGLGGSIFLSAWVIARGRISGQPVTPRVALFDFHVGYIMSLVLAFCFLLMGTVVLLGREVGMAGSSAAFAAQFVGIFTEVIGQWTELVVSVAAITVMLSTVLAVVDGFPRVYANVVTKLASGAGVPSEERLYRGFLWFQIVTSGVVLYALPRSFGAFIDFITAVGFLTGPVVAFMNHRIMFCGEIPPDRQPPQWIRYWSVAGTTILAVIFPIYLYFRLT